jgi:hypothetical protein
MILASMQDMSFTELYTLAALATREAKVKEELSFANRSNGTVDGGQGASLMSEDSGGSREMSLVTEAGSGIHSDDLQADTGVLFSLYIVFL